MKPMNVTFILLAIIILFKINSYADQPLSASQTTPTPQNVSLAKVYLLKAQKWAKEGDFEMAHANYEKVKLLAPDLALKNQLQTKKDKKINYWLTKYHDTLFLDEKLACLEKGLQLEPHHPNLLLKKAQCEYKLKRYKKAIETSQQLLKQNHQNQKALKIIKKSNKKLKKKK